MELADLNPSALMRQTLLGMSRNTTLRQAIEHAPVSRDVVKRFVAGDATPDAVRVAGSPQRLAGAGSDLTRIAGGAGGLAHFIDLDLGKGCRVQPGAVEEQPDMTYQRFSGSNLAGQAGPAERVGKNCGYRLDGGAEQDVGGAGSDLR